MRATTCQYLLISQEIYIYIYIYIVQKDDYNKYVRDNVTKTYKRSTAIELNIIKKQSYINYKLKLLAEMLAFMIELKK